MKARNFITLAIILAAAGSTAAQTRIRRPCPASATFSIVDLERDGDINLRPCSGRSVLVNSSGLSGILSSLNGLTAAAQVFAAPAAADTAAWSSTTATHTLQLPITAISGGSRTNFVPFLDTPNTLSKSGLSWNGATYRFDNNNSTPNTTFPLTFTPQKVGSDGVFQVGSAGSAQLTVNQSGAFLALTSSQISISAGTYLVNASMTPGGTTGNVTINQAIGSVNFAAGGSALTVTNSVATASSIVLATARTHDATCAVKSVVPSTGSFIIRMTAACTAETSVGFWVLN